MVPQDKAIIKLHEIETEEVHVVDVFESDKKKEFTKKDGTKGEILLPFRIRVEDARGNIVSEEESSATLSTNQWTKKFYRNEGGYWNYTRGETLLALLEIMRANNHILAKELEEKREFNINNLKGFKFKAALSSYNGARFINWVQTFTVNNVEVPKQGEAVKAEQDESGLPF